MAEIMVENQLCSGCGSDIRKGALFCYYCGDSVASKIIAPTLKKIEDEDRITKKENNKENGKEISRPFLEDESENGLILPKDFVEDQRLNDDKPEASLKSAAALRKKAKNVPKKKVEIVWEEYENAPNMWFILVAVLLLLFTFGILWMALYFG